MLVMSPEQQAVADEAGDKPVTGFEQPEKKEKHKPFMIAFPNTIAYEDAMVIKMLNTVIAVLAVRRLGRLLQLTGLAEAVANNYYR